jgi:TonB family protein
MRARIQGEVELSAIVRPDGTVTDLRISRSLDHVFGLDGQAIKAARQWRFKPATRFGQPGRCVRHDCRRIHDALAAGPSDDVIEAQCQRGDQQSEGRRTARRHQQPCRERQRPNQSKHDDRPPSVRLAA